MFQRYWRTWRSGVQNRDKRACTDMRHHVVAYMVLYNTNNFSKLRAVSSTYVPEGRSLKLLQEIRTSPSTKLCPIPRSSPASCQTLGISTSAISSSPIVHFLHHFLHTHNPLKASDTKGIPSKVAVTPAFTQFAYNNATHSSTSVPLLCDARIRPAHCRPPRRRSYLFESSPLCHEFRRGTSVPTCSNERRARRYVALR